MLSGVCLEKDWAPRSQGTLECGTNHERDIGRVGSTLSWLEPSSVKAQPQSSPHTRATPSFGEGDIWIWAVFCSVKQNRSPSKSDQMCNWVKLVLLLSRSYEVSCSCKEVSEFPYSFPSTLLGTLEWRCWKASLPPGAQGPLAGGGCLLTRLLSVSLWL